MFCEIPAELARELAMARRVVVLTGAGVSAESGVPTFREAQTGLWARFRPEDLATPEAFRRHPRRVWDWYAMRREMVGKVRPNAGHEALVAMEARVPEFLLVTQNVDGLHQAAGSRRVVELHGNLRRILCAEEGVEVTEWEEVEEMAPRCPRCGGLLRPGVVWFGEALPEAALAVAQEAARGCDLLISAGTSSVVYPAAGLMDEALDAGAVVVEVNPAETPYSERVRWTLRGASGVVLPAWVRAAWPQADSMP